MPNASSLPPPHRSIPSGSGLGETPFLACSSLAQRAQSEQAADAAGIAVDSACVFFWKRSHSGIQATSQVRAPTQRGHHTPKASAQGFVLRWDTAPGWWAHVVGPGVWWPWAHFHPLLGCEVDPRETARLRRVSRGCIRHSQTHTRDMRADHTQRPDLKMPRADKNSLVTHAKLNLAYFPRQARLT